MESKLLRLIPLSGKYGTGRFASINDEDYDKVKDIKWYAGSSNDKNHVIGNIKVDGKRKTIDMGRLIMEDVPHADWENTVDHINRNPMDQRSDNLRWVSQQQQLMNRGKFRNNTSGVTGVTYSKDRRKWVAQIKINSKTKHLGQFNNFEDAVAKRKEAEAFYFGNFAAIDV